MNHSITPTTATAAASLWFAEYLQEKLGGLRCGNHPDESAVKLAKAIGIERKSLYAYAHCERSPRLDIVAKVLEYYGETEIAIPLIFSECPQTCAYCKYFDKRNDEKISGYCSVTGRAKYGEEGCKCFKSKN